MREIKFRAWDKKRELMTPLGSLEIWIMSMMESTLESSLVPLFMEDHTFMQYTGLKDKNGKEIYEGDIVHCVYKQRNVDEPFEVVYDVMFAGFQPFCQPIDYDEIYLSDYKVIGNIYENKELLK